MKLSASPHLDALCGEFLVGTLRGAARRRFVRAIEEEPAVAHRLAAWQNLFTPRPSEAMAMAPSTSTWRRIARDLELGRFRTPWYARVGVWRGWAVAATAALTVWIGVTLIERDPGLSPMQPIATLESGEGAAGVVASLSDDGRWLALEGERVIDAGPKQSYELWLLPPDGTAPRSIAVFGRLAGRVPVPAALVGQFAVGAKLAVSVEPAGGSPTGAPTGAVILVGAITPV